MEIAKIKVSGTRMEVIARQEIPAGIQGGTIAFSYDARWASLAKTVVFQSTLTKDVVNAGEVVTIPGEVTRKAGAKLWVGIYGVEGETVAIPTLWTDLGIIRTGADPSGDTTTEASLPVWAQLQADMGDPGNLTTESRENLVCAVNELAEKTEPEHVKAIVEEYMAENPISSGSGAVDATLSVSGAAADAKATGEALGQLLLDVYPVGVIFTTADTRSPADLFGGIWEQLEDTGLSGVYTWKRMSLGIAVYIVTQPQDTAVANGGTAYVTVEAMGDELTYAWYYRNPGATNWSRSNSTTSEFTTSMDSSKDGRQVYCVITDCYGNTVTTDTVTITMLS